MAIEFDPAKREATLKNRGLDMARAQEIFDGSVITALDRRIISMRKANEREQAAYGPRLD
jgi:uncharacterized DUF497 family protein